MALVLVGAAIFLLEERKPDTSQGPVEELAVIGKEEKAEMYEPAKEISTPDAFINTEPITIGELIGEKVILVDFWTYSCINCQRTLPYLNEWHEKYVSEGLVILGIHTPEFEFEEDLENVKRAVEKFNVKYPVILDNDYSTWRAYQNRFWPRKYIVDVDGFIVYDHIGEGAYEETEEKIVELLSELNQREVEMKTGSLTEKDEVDFSKVRSPEMYLGSSRVENLINSSGQNCVPGVCEYSLPQNVKLNEFALGGKWRIEKERAVLESNEGGILLRFSASKVNLVAGGLQGNVNAEIYLDGKKVGSSSSGAQVQNGEVIFSTNDLYNLIDLRGNYGEHLLEIRLKNSGFEAFAFTFG